MGTVEGFIVCRRRAGAPRMAPSVCRTCRHRKKCADWQAYVNPPLFPELLPPQPMPRKKRGR